MLSPGWLLTQMRSMLSLTCFFSVGQLTLKAEISLRTARGESRRELSFLPPISKFGKHFVKLSLRKKILMMPANERIMSIKRFPVHGQRTHRVVGMAGFVCFRFPNKENHERISQARGRAEYERRFRWLNRDDVLAVRLLISAKGIESWATNLREIKILTSGQSPAAGSARNPRWCWCWRSQPRWSPSTAATATCAAPGSRRPRTPAGCTWRDSRRPAWLLRKISRWLKTSFGDANGWATRRRRFFFVPQISIVN